MVASAMPLISVVVPAHNAALTITRALDSVLAQDFSDLEVLVIDDRSGDGTGSLASAHPIAPRLLKSDKPGAARARNVGIQHSRGRYVAFLDADDYWLPGKLVTQLSIMESCPEFGLCCSRGLFQNADGTLAPPNKVTANDGVCTPLGLLDIILNPYLGTPGVLARRDILIQVGGFRDALKTAEDVDLWLRIGALTAAVSIDWPLFVVCRSSTSLSAVSGDATFETNLRVLDDLSSLSPFCNKDARRSLRIARARVFCEWGSAALCRSEIDQAKSLLVASLRCMPTARAAYLLIKCGIRFH